MSRHISTLDLHRFRYDELDSAERERVGAHLDDCDRCQRRLGAQQAERQAFVFARTPDLAPTPIAHAAPAEAPANRPSWRGWLPAVALGLAAATAALVALPRIDDPIEPDTVVSEVVRPKGTLPDLELWLDGPGGARPLAEGESLAAGDRVQLQFRPHGAAWITLAGRDGTGAVEVWGALEPDGDKLQAAPFALTLDDAPGPQVFFAVGADRPLTPREIERALEGRLDHVDILELVVPKQ